MLTYRVREHNKNHRRWYIFVRAYVYKRHSRHPPSRRSSNTMVHTTASNISKCVELVRVCRLAVVVAAATCCSYCDYENPPPPNEARDIRSEGDCVNFRPAGRQGGTCFCWPHGGGYGGYRSHMFERIELIANSFDSSGHDCSNHPIFTAMLSL